MIFIALLLLSVANARAQRDYRHAYIINNQHDTIYGWIDYRGEVRNAKICSFRKTETGQTTDYTPSDIAAYRFIDSKYYVSKDLGTSDTPKMVFLEYLVNGLAKLFYYRGESTNDFYYIEKDGQFHELKIDKREVEVDGKTGIKTVKSYIGILRATLNVLEMNDQINKASLEHSSLIDIAKNYHRLVCTDGNECIIYEKKKPLMALRIGPMVGADLSTLKIIHDDYERYRFEPSTNFTIGMSLNFWMPRVNEKIFLKMHIMYTKYYFFNAFEDAQETIDTHFRSNVLQMGIGVKYEYPKGKWRPTLAAGTTANYLTGVSIKNVINHFSEDVVRSTTEKMDFPNIFIFMSCFEINPGIHYHTTKKWIIFAQLKYFLNYKLAIQSFGLSTGIYF